ncbi:motility protein A [Anaerovorax sp. IOR16]|uniref:motility protein A n=1 Tax=Anaerovorax sp. IOR16 TaxID=2773458 RepID=UPI0019D0506D|nr:motility protein A [Anaerovorax sp. IOR16]
MDFTSIIGIISCILLVISGIIVEKTGINVGSLINFADPQSALIVIGGTFAAIFASFSISSLKAIPKHLKIIITKDKHNPIDYIDAIVGCAEIARKNGLLALEEHANEQEDPFLKSSLLLIVDAIDADKVRAMLEGDLGYMSTRHEEAVSIYEKGAALAPAFGMIGTLIGLINMLAGLDLNAENGTDSLTSGMAVALITTFYGSLLANVFFTPVANKLQVRHERELLCKQIIIEGILSIQSGENPKFIREKLMSFLSEKDKISLSGGGDEDDGGKKKKKPKKEKKKK